jgi:catechol 2,3-dioxygenase-like lactoylglutathione lyase family enzyme
LRSCSRIDRADNPPLEGEHDQTASVVDLHAMPLDTPILFLATADAVRARAFYESTLGLACVADEPFALVFQVGRSMLRIQKVSEVHAPPYTALGWAVADIRETVRALNGSGVAFERFDGMDQDANGIWKSPSGASIAWFRDPDGHLLSLTQHA